MTWDVRKSSCKKFWNDLNPHPKQFEVIRLKIRWSKFFLDSPQQDYHYLEYFYTDIALGDRFEDDFGEKIAKIWISMHIKVKCFSKCLKDAQVSPGKHFGGDSKITVWRFWDSIWAKSRFSTILLQFSFRKPYVEHFWV